MRDFRPLRRLELKLKEASELNCEILYLGHIPGAPWRQKRRPGLYEAEYLWTCPSLKVRGSSMPRTVAYVLWPGGARKCGRPTVKTC